MTWELKKPIVAKSPEEEAYSKAETNFENAKNSTLKAPVSYTHLDVYKRQK